MADKKHSNRLESPVATYAAAMNHPGHVARSAADFWLATLRAFGMPAADPAAGTMRQIRDAVRTGAPRALFDQLKQNLGISSEELCDVVGITTRTLARRTDRFKPDESERLLRVAGVFAKAVDVLEDEDAARHWMSRPKSALGGLTPLRCCDTEIGTRETEALLGRIEHGVFS